MEYVCVPLYTSSWNKSSKSFIARDILLTADMFDTEFKRDSNVCVCVKLFI